MAKPSLPTRPIARHMQKTAEKRLLSYPVLTITGPRQSGKTTLARMLRPKFLYFSLENPDTRAFAEEDPRGFLKQAKNGAILDEIQRVPSLLSYLQGEVDSNRAMGRFILTRSSQFELIESVTQSLAGRSALLTLLPFTLGELQAAKRAPVSVDQLLHQGLFPPIYDRPVPATTWLQDYVGTYLERDVRAILNIQNMESFQRFVQLCAGRCGQLINILSLANDTGISRATAQSWLTVLQASHLIFMLQPWFSNRSKRLIKSPKLYFCDAGLAAWLIGVREISHLTAHPQRGALFENWVMTELLKAQLNAGQKPSLNFLRNKQGNEIDALVETAPGHFHAVEVKSGATVVSRSFDGLEYWKNKLSESRISPWLVYGGDAQQQRAKGHVLPWSHLEPLLNQISKKP